MTLVFKVLFIFATAAAAAYSMKTFGPGAWSAIFIGVPVFVAASLYVGALQSLAKDVAKISGGLAAAAFCLLMVAGTTGGSFRLDDSNAVFAVLLAAMAVTGLSAIGWRVVDRDAQRDAQVNAPGGDPQDSTGGGPGDERL